MISFAYRIIAEESAAKDEKIPELTEAPTWLIDPIDGTTNFIHTFPHCCISIGLAVNKCLEVGLIYNPNNNEMYTAIRGNGAFLNNEQIRTSCVTGKQNDCAIINCNSNEILETRLYLRLIALCLQNWTNHW